MFKLVSFFLGLWLCMVLLSGILAGGSALAVTTLTQDETAVTVTLHVADTTGLLTEDTMKIGGEEVHYTGTTGAPAPSLTGCTRGYNNTEAKAHANGALVQSLDPSALNVALGFSVPLLADQMGWLAFVAIPITFITTTIPRAIAFNYNFLQGEMMLIGLFFFALGAAFIFTLAWSVIGARRV